MRIKRNIIPKIACGLVVAFALINIPLPALATTSEQPVEPESVITAPEPVNQQPSQPLPLEETVPTPTATLQSNTTEATTETTPSGSAGNGQPSQTTAQVRNGLDSTATSGDATVTENETGGDASTGNATSEGTVLNVVNANGAPTSNFQTFQCDVDDRQENLIIDPTSLLPICKSTSVGASAQPSANTQGLQTGASLVDILNNIALTAASGNATVSGNETGGNASTGNATALANVVNIANTAITARNSFLGVINIHGELKGNILVPQAIIDSLGASQSGGAKIDTTSIKNTVEANATSGNAEVSGNEEAGSASTGEAATSVTIMNLTGQKVVAKNSLLVFVNVLGKWMGLIVPAGQGQSTALLGSGVQQSGSNGVTDYASGETTTRITNNISVDAHSGDAGVSNNETGGSASTGNAKAGANLLNITDSEFQLDDWFGILFINVLGNWLGNFDIQAALKAENGGQQQVVQDVRVYQFSEPTPVAAPNSRPVFATTDAPAVPAVAAPEAEAISNSSGVVLSSQQQTDDSQAKPALKLDIFGLSIVVLGLSALIATATIAIRHWRSV